MGIYTKKLFLLRYTNFPRTKKRSISLLLWKRPFLKFSSYSWSKFNGTLGQAEEIIYYWMEQKCNKILQQCIQYFWFCFFVCSVGFGFCFCWALFFLILFWFWWFFWSIMQNLHIRCQIGFLFPIFLYFYFSYVSVILSSTHSSFQLQFLKID